MSPFPLDALRNAWCCMVMPDYAVGVEHHPDTPVSGFGTAFFGMNTHNRAYFIRRADNTPRTGPKTG